MTYIKIFIIVCLLILNAMFLYSDDGQGGLPGAFLRTGVGARALGMGRAFTAFSDDATSAYWNPAGLALLDKTEVHSTLSVLSMDRTNSYIACAISLTNTSSLSFSWLKYGDSNIIGRNINGTFTESFEKTQNAFLVSYGRAMSGKLFLGANFKYLSHHLFDHKASGTGFDVGALVVPHSRVRMGIVIQDISSYLSWDTVSETTEKFPLITRIGFSIIPYMPSLKIGFDYEKVKDLDASLHYGFEYSPVKSLQLRGGYDHSFTFGGSILIPVENLNLKIDYSIREDLIDKSKMHQFSLSTQLGQPKRNSYSNLEEELRDVFQGITSPLARVIKVTDKNPDYVLINAGRREGLFIGQMLNIYRDITIDEMTESTLISEGKVVKCKENFSAIKLLNLQEGFQIEINDFVYLQ